LLDAASHVLDAGDVRRALVSLAVFVGACGALPPAAAPTPIPTASAPAALQLAPLEACGTVKAWTAPTATQAGSVTIGSKTHTVNAGTNHGATGFVVSAGKEMCLFGGLDGQTQPYHGATAIDSPFCGAVLAFTPATATATGTITILHFAAAALAVQPGTDLGMPPLGMRRCVTVGTTASGDPLVRARAAPSILDMELHLWCGSVKSYAAGSAIGIGSRRWEMAGAVPYDMAGPNGPDRTAAGTAMCLTAALDDQGRITRYLTGDLPMSEGGLVTSYAAATPTATGTLVFSYKYVRTIARGTELDVKAGAYACVRLGLDDAGDAVITGTIACGGVGF
jgi:hypothetical protein